MFSLERRIKGVMIIIIASIYILLSGLQSTLQILPDFILTTASEVGFIITHFTNEETEAGRLSDFPRIIS